MTINNTAFLQSAYRNSYINQTGSVRSLNRVSTGYKINRAADNAAGLAISERMRGQIGGMDMAYANAMNGISMVQTAEGGLDTGSAIVTRMRELAVQAQNGTMTEEQRGLANLEFQNLKSELDRGATAANYNNIKLLDGSLGGQQGARGLSAMGIDRIAVGGSQSMAGQARFSIARGDDGTLAITAQLGGETVASAITDATATGATFAFADGTELSLAFTGTAADVQAGNINNVGVQAGASATDLSGAMSSTAQSRLVFQVGANGSPDQRIGLHVNDMSSVGLGVQDLDILSVDNANAAIAALDGATSSISAQRSVLGATQNRLEHTVSNLGTTRLNLTQAESSIRDADVAKEIMDHLQKNIMVQASQAMLSQGMNLSQMQMLSLLR